MRSRFWVAMGRAGREAAALCHRVVSTVYGYFAARAEAVAGREPFSNAASLVGGAPADRLALESHPTPRYNEDVPRFRPPWWARSPHVQTITPTVFPGPRPELRHETFDLPDGDFVQLSWACEPRPGRPLLVLVHGLDGSADSSYIRRMIADARARGVAVVAHHHRGCGLEPNRKPRAYHSGDTADIGHVFDAMARRWPDSPLWVAGYSLGANQLVKYLGERGDDTPVARAAAVSPPLDLAACVRHMERGLSRGYARYLLRGLRAAMHRKLDDPEMAPAMPFDRAELARADSLRAYDDLVTARLHGFEDADDYYARSSALPYLSKVERPLLVLHAADDPLMSDAVIPKPAQIGDRVTYELWPHGGHVGFIEGGWPWRPRFYLERRLLDFFEG